MRDLDQNVVKYWKLGASHETEQFFRRKFNVRLKNRTLVGKPNPADERLIRTDVGLAGLDQFRHQKPSPFDVSRKLLLPLVLSSAGLQLTARRYDRHICYRPDGENLMDELIQPIGIADDDAESTHARQVLREQRSTLHQAVGSRSHLLLNKQPA